MAQMTRPRALSASTLIGDDVVNRQGESLGQVVDIMINLDRGDVDYVVLSFGGVLGIGDKLFALPWQSISVDTENHNFVVDVDRERLENAPGFDKDHWPNTGDEEFTNNAYNYWGVQRRRYGEQTGSEYVTGTRSGYGAGSGGTL